MTKRVVTGATLLFTFGLGLGCGAGASGFFVPPVRAGTNPQRWEYTCFRGLSDVEERANRLGRQGWEMAAVAATRSVDNMGWCFKRPLP